MPNNITAPRVPLTDPTTGLIHREWYRFFLTLYELVLAGNSVSIADLQVSPLDAALPQLDVLAALVQGALLLPSTEAPQTAQDPSPAGPSLSDILELAGGLQALQVAPPYVPPPAPLPAVRTATTTPITVTSAEAAVCITIYVKLAAPGAVAVALPAGFTGATVTVKDGTGDAAANNITTTPAAGNIDGAATDVINVNYGARTYIYTGTEWSNI